MPFFVPNAVLAEVLVDTSCAASPDVSHRVGGGDFMHDQAVTEAKPVQEERE